MRALLRDLLHALEHQRDVIYCCLVETKGSTPQKAGAAMLVFADGSQRGTLGGGCVEAEVKQQALRTLHDQAPARILTFNLDNNYGWDDGLICGGRMSILVDPLTPTSPHLASSLTYYRTWQQKLDRGEGCQEAIVVKEDDPQLPAGARFLFDAEQRRIAQSSSAAPTEQIQHNLPALENRPRPRVKQGVAYLPTLPRITLLIVGGGHVGQAVAQLAAQADFGVWVLDDREAYANAERFPSAEKHLIGDIGSTLKEIVEKDVTSSTYAIIVTRGHNHDEEALYHLAPSQAAYVGMIGSKRKIRLIYEDLIAKDISEETLSKVHAPLGFDIGSQTVPEIAISIVAELISRRNLGTTSLTPRDRAQTGTT